MTLGLFDREAILNILRGVYVARNPEAGDDFCKALVAVGLACGAFEIVPAEVTSATAGNLLFERKVIAASEPAVDPPIPRG